MKKTLFIFLFIVMSGMSFGQVFHSGEILKKGAFELGVNPAIHIHGLEDGFNLFLHGGYGLKSGIDLGITFGFTDAAYLGANVEWALMKHLSLTTGFHYFGGLGLDGTLILTIPLRSDAKLYTGLDIDIYVESSNLPLWLPFGVEIFFKSNVAFILETEIGITDPAYHVIGGGVNFYF